MRWLAQGVPFQPWLGRVGVNDPSSSLRTPRIFSTIRSTTPAGQTSFLRRSRQAGEACRRTILTSKPASAGGWIVPLGRRSPRLAVALLDHPTAETKPAAPPDSSAAADGRNAASSQPCRPSRKRPGDVLLPPLEPFGHRSKFFITAPNTTVAQTMSARRPARAWWSDGRLAWEDHAVRAIIEQPTGTRHVSGPGSVRLDERAARPATRLRRRVEGQWRVAGSERHRRFYPAPTTFLPPAPPQALPLW